MQNGEFHTEVNGLKLWYKIQGTGPLLFLPTAGWGVSAEEYFLTMTNLTDAFTLVYHDTRGTGRSQKPASTKQYKYIDFASDFEGLRRVLNKEKLLVMGHSLGTALAVQYSLKYPEHCEGLVLLESYLESDEQHSKWVEQYENKRSHQDWYSEVMKACEINNYNSDKEFAENVSARLPLYFHDQQNLKKALPALDKSKASLHAWKGWADSEKMSVSYLESVSQIQCPVLMIVGDDDFICPPEASQRVQERIPNSILKVIKNSGHFPWIENPQDFREALLSGFKALFSSSP